MNTTTLFRKMLTIVGMGALCAGGGVAAQNNEEDLNKTLSPYFVVISDNPETDALP